MKKGPIREEDRVFYRDRKTILSLLLNIVEENPTLTVAQIICSLMRKKGGAVDPFFWSDAQLIQRLRDMIQDLFDNPIEIEKDF